MKCRDCNSEVERVTCTIDPQRVTHRWIAGCGHPLAAWEARALWVAGVRWDAPRLTGVNLLAAEQYRVRTEEGFTEQHDERHDAQELPWAAWALLDRAVAGGGGDEVPSMWPFGDDRWPSTQEPLRQLVIAGTFIASEIDRRLRAGERVRGTDDE